MAREELARLLSCLLKSGQSARCCDDLAEFESRSFAELLHGKNSFHWFCVLLLTGTAESGRRGAWLIGDPDFGYLVIVCPSVKDAPRLVLEENNNGSGCSNCLVPVNVSVLAWWQTPYHRYRRAAGSQKREFSIKRSWASSIVRPMPWSIKT